jgi:hypothetical protein
MDHAEIRSSRFREVAGDALRYWELRRIVYNCVLTAVIIGWVVLTWPTSVTQLENDCSRAAGERLLLRRLRRRHSLVAVIPDEAVAALAPRSLAGRNSFRNSAGN